MKFSLLASLNFGQSSDKPKQSHYLTYNLDQGRNSFKEKRRNLIQLRHCSQFVCFITSDWIITLFAPRSVTASVLAFHQPPSYPVIRNK